MSRTLPRTARAPIKSCPHIASITKLGLTTALSKGPSSLEWCLVLSNWVFLVPNSGARVRTNESHVATTLLWVPGVWRDIIQAFWLHTMRNNVVRGCPRWGKSGVHVQECGPSRSSGCLCLVTRHMRWASVPIYGSSRRLNACISVSVMHGERQHLLVSGSNERSISPHLLRLEESARLCLSCVASVPTPFRASALTRSSRLT